MMGARRMRCGLPLLATLAVVVLGLVGCSHPPKFLHWAKATPVKVDLPSLDPNGAENRLYARGARAIEDRDYGEALEVLQYALSARSGDPRVLTAMAVVYDKLGRFDLSDRYYALAEKADPGSRVVAMDRRYSLLLRQHTPGEDAADTVRLAAVTAPEFARTALQARATDDDALYARAVGAIQQGELGAALGMLQLARSTRPADPRVLSALGVIYDRLGRFDLSQRCYDLAEQADPGSKVVAIDRRYSRLLAQHGGSAEAGKVTLLTDARGARPRPVIVEGHQG